VASIRELPFFSAGEALPEISTAPELDSSTFEMENPGDVGQHVNVPGGFAVVQYLEKRDPHDPTFEEVKTKVEQRYRFDKSKDLALERARQIAQAKTPDEMKNLATSFGLKTDERAGLPATDSIGPLNTEESREPVYALKAGEVTHEPIKTESGNSYVVVALTERKDADMGEAYTKEKKAIEQRLLEEKRNTYFNTYLKLLQKQLQDDGTIKVYKARLDSAMDASASQPGASPQRPGMPGGMPQPGRSAPRRTPQGGPRPQGQ
jgi:peptidyl-prolyl cis-trans isomerase D